MKPYGNKNLVDAIIARVKEEGGHLELTEDFLFKKTKIEFTDIYADASVKYTRTDGEVTEEVSSSLHSINDRVLQGILDVLSKNKFI